MSSSSRKKGGFDRRKLNPAFAAAHGIGTSSDRQPAFRDTALSAEDAQRKKSAAAAAAASTSRPLTFGARSDDDGGGSGAGGRAFSQKRLDHALRAARSTGRLNLSDCGLTSPLPEEAFDLRRGATVDLSLDRDDSDVNHWEMKGEEELTLVDLSDNDLSKPRSSSSRSRNAPGGASYDGGGKVGGGGDGEEDDGELDGRIERFAAARILRCRRCRLRFVPWPAIGGLDCLTVLDLSGNGIRSAALQFLPMGLRELDLSSNRISSLSRFEEGGERRVGGVEEDGSEEAEIVLPGLILLDVSANELEAFPEKLRLGALQTLRFGKNRVVRLDDELMGQCSESIATLEGPGNRLSEVPDLSGCKSLRVVDFCDNDLRQVPMIHSSLVRLALSNNAITSIDAFFGKVPAGHSELFRSSLTELRLRQNKVATLDSNILSCLTKLTLLDLGENELRDLPHVLGYLPDLRRIPLDRNPLRAIRLSLADDTDALKKSLRKRGPPPPGPGYIQSEARRSGDPTEQSEVDESEAKSLVNESMVGSHILDLSNKNLSGIPIQIVNELQHTSGSIGSFEGGPRTVGASVKGLRLSHNSLQALGDEIFDALPNLQKLDAGHNKIKSLTNRLESVPMVTLELARNQLSSEAVGASPLCRVNMDARMAHSLTSLNLSSNCIEWIPSGLFSLPMLSTLVLSHNKIGDLSRTEDRGWHPGLPSLENLDLSSNQISELADLPTILAGCCSKLRSLQLNNNELRSIPSQLGLVQSLNAIDLRGNPQRSVRLAVLDRSCGGILSYLRSRMEPSELQAAQKRQLEFSKQAKQHVAKDTNSLHSNETIESYGAPQRSSGRADSGTASSNVQTMVSPLAEELRSDIEHITMKLNNVHLTEAKKYAMKKTLAMQKAKLIREERRLRAEAELNK